MLCEREPVAGQRVEALLGGRVVDRVAVGEREAPVGGQRRLGDDVAARVADDHARAVGAAGGRREGERAARAGEGERGEGAAAHSSASW